MGPTPLVQLGLHVVWVFRIGTMNTLEAPFNFVFSNAGQGRFHHEFLLVEVRLPRFTHGPLRALRHHQVPRPLNIVLSHAWHLVTQESIIFDLLYAFLLSDPFHDLEDLNSLRLPDHLR